MKAAGACARSPHLAEVHRVEVVSDDGGDLVPEEETLLDRVAADVQVPVLHPDLFLGVRLVLRPPKAARKREGERGNKREREPRHCHSSH